MKLVGYRQCAHKDCDRLGWHPDSKFCYFDEKVHAG
jgi:hypothetical protein